MMPELNDMFLYPNQTIILEEANQDHAMLLETSIDHERVERKPKLTVAKVDEKPLIRVVNKVDLWDENVIPKSLAEVEMSKLRKKWIDVAMKELEKLQKFGTFRLKHVLREYTSLS